MYFGQNVGKSCQTTRNLIYWKIHLPALKLQWYYPWEFNNKRRECFIPSSCNERRWTITGDLPSCFERRRNISHVKYVCAKMLCNNITWLLTTNQRIAKYYVTWIWIQFYCRTAKKQHLCTLQNKLGLGKPNACVLLMVKIHITQG